MSPKQKPQPNQLVLYRRRMGFSQKHVAQLLGHKDASLLSHYERGRRLPTLLTALRLEIVYRVPVAFLYRDLYEELREEIRAQEEEMRQKGQQALF